jgi:hypothetical protein
MVSLSTTARVVGGVFLVAAVATAADAVWYTFGVRHTVLAGVAHGALLLAAVGGVIGAASGRLPRGLLAGMLAGVGGALAYYALVAVTGGSTYGSAIPVAWVVVWVLLAAIQGRWLRAPLVRSWREIAVRGAIAALSSGVAFVAVLSTLWGGPPAGGRNYLLQFAAWTVAWAPGLFALTLERPPTRRVPHG